MTQDRRRRMRFLAAIFAAVGIYVMSDSTVLGAASATMYPVCSDYCSDVRPCDTVCQIPDGEFWQLSTCGDYDGGWLNDHCAGDTCQYDCDPGVACGHECWEAGEPSDCETFGVCQTCGDGVCAGTETSYNCSEDCGDPPPSGCDCGDNVCDPRCGEAYDSCPDDCDPPSSGYCGDFICDEGDDEDAENCPEDCATRVGYCTDCPLDYLCIQNVCSVPAALYVLPQCTLADPECACGFKCVQTEYPDPYNQYGKLTVCMPDWDIIFDPYDPCGYFTHRR